MEVILDKVNNWGIGRRECPEVAAVDFFGSKMEGLMRCMPSRQDEKTIVMRCIVEE